MLNKGDTFSEWLTREWAKDPDNMCPPPLKAEEALYFLSEYLLGDKWYEAMPMSLEQMYTDMVAIILLKYSKRFRKENRLRKRRKRQERRKNA